MDSLNLLITLLLKLRNNVSQTNFRCFQNEFLNRASKLKVEDKDTLRVIDCTALHCNRWFREGRSDALGMFERLYARAQMSQIN